MPPLQRLLLACLLALPCGFSARAAGPGDNPFVARHLASAERLRGEGKLAEARAAVELALERDDQHLRALRLLAEIAGELGDRDAAVYAWHRWIAVVDASERPAVRGAERKAVLEQLALLDVTASEFRRLADQYVEGLLQLAQEQLKRKRFHSALALYEEILLADPRHAAARRGIADIRRRGGADVATEDVYAGLDPTFGASPEWIAAEDAKHATWDAAWTKDGENYRYRTDAGFLVLQTSSIAMEQMNRFYRQFFRYKLDGDPTPKIEVRVFQDRDEYLKLGSSPAPWSGGQYTGDAVETYVGGVSGQESVREMYGTLFHEAAHQFVGLTGRGGVPGWLNEAYASFFEGCTILSNGSVRWNQVPNHRLFPLADRLERGWMSQPDDGVRDERGEWREPERAPTFRTVVEGGYEWGPPWYAPTWGVVYFLYNYRDSEGRAVWRDALHEYYLSGAAGRPDPAAWFEEKVLAAPGSPVRDVDDLSALWRDWLLDLRDVQLGRKEAGRSSVEYGEAARSRGENELAQEFFEEAYSHFPEDPEILWKLAQVLEEQKELDRAAALYRSFSRELELRGLTADERYPVARRKMEELDPLFRRQAQLRRRLLDEGLTLARGYRERGLPTMALDVARRLSGSFSLPEALEFYTNVARETGRSLAHWKVAYNETDLSGWSGGEGFRAAAEIIEAAVPDDPSAPGGSFVTRELACDVTFDADFSLEAEMRAQEGARLMGLCFGRKDANNTHAVVLHPKGFLDVSTRHGSSWTVREHREVKLAEEWQRLRVDVVDDTVDIYLNGRYIRSMRMPSRDSVRGGFGLIAGVGACAFRNVRLLARDPHDPAARVERELAMARVYEDPVQREPGSFAGVAPPPLELAAWIQGDPLPPLAELRGQPVVLVFWTPGQDRLIPTAAYYAQLARDYGPLGLRFLAVVNSQEKPADVAAYLAEHPMPGVSVALDATYRTYTAYNLRPGGFGMPRILLVDVDGTVCWEGDPGLKIGVGWEPGSGETFLDGALRDLVEQRRLRELAALAPRMAEALALEQEGRFREALELAAPLAELDAAFAPSVQEARALRQRAEAGGAGLLQRAQDLREQNQPLRAAALLRRVATDFAGTTAADLGAARRAELEATAEWKAAQRGYRFLERAAEQAERGRDAEALARSLDAAAASSAAADLQEWIQALRDALARGGAAALLEAWRTLAAP